MESLNAIVSPLADQRDTNSLLDPLPQYRPWRFDNRVTGDLLEEIAFLQEEAEKLKTLRLEVRDSQHQVDVIEIRLKDLLDVVEHRKRLLRRYRNDPLAPSWPKVTGKLGQLASDLKQIWPLPRFCREMLLLNLQGRGDRLRAICPIPTHSETTPSFVIFTSEDRFHCFGCGAHGDVFELIQAIYGHEDFRSQVRMLAEATGQSMGAAR